MLTTPDFCFARISSWSALALASEAGATIFAHGPRSPARKRSALTGSSFGGRAAPGAAGAPVGGGSQNPAMRSVGVAGGESAPNVSGVIGVDHPSSSGAACGSSSAPGGGSSSRASSASRGGPDASSPEDGAARAAPRTRDVTRTGIVVRSSSGRFGSFPRPRFATLSVASNDPSADPAIVRAAREETAKKKVAARRGQSLSGESFAPGAISRSPPGKALARATPTRARARAEIESARRADERARRDPIGSGERSRGGAGGGAPGATSKRASDAPKCFSTARANTPPARGTLMKNRQSDAATLESAPLRTAPRAILSLTVCPYGGGIFSFFVDWSLN